MRTEYDIMAEGNRSSLRKHTVTVAGICASWPTHGTCRTYMGTRGGVYEMEVGASAHITRCRVRYVRLFRNPLVFFFFKPPKSVDGTLTSCVGGIDPSHPIHVASHELASRPGILLLGDYKP